MGPSTVGGKGTKIAAGAALVAAALVAVFGPKIGKANTSDIATYVVAALAAVNGAIHVPTVKKAVQKVAPQSKPKRPKAKAPRPFFMYDTITVQSVPAKPGAVAGYVGGHWPTYNELVRLFPKAKHLSIAVNASENAECLDIESGDATPDQAPAWCQRQHARGVARPCVYASISAMPVVLYALNRAGIHRSQVRLWTAHYTNKPHLCNQSCWPSFRSVADATQYTDRAYSRNLDESYCAGNFL